jgi:PAS domain S-box-containing protein
LFNRQLYLWYYFGAEENMSVVPHFQKTPDNRERLQTELLAEVANIVAAILDRDTVLRRCLQEIGRVIEFDTATIALFSRGIEWQLAVGVGYKNEEYTNLESAKVLKESPILTQMAKDHQPILSPDVNQLPGWMWIPGAEHVRSFIAVPMIAYDQMIGVLMLDNSQEAFFDESDMAVLQTLARTLAVAVEKAQLYEAMQQRLMEQDALLAVSNAVSSSLELDVVLNKLAEQMARAIQVTSAYISDWNPEKGTATVIAEYVSPEACEKESVSDLGVTYHLGDDFGDDQDWLHLGDIRMEHVDTPGLQEQSREHYLEYGAKSIMIVPLIVKGQSVGFAELWESRYIRYFTSDEIALVQAMAQQAAVAIENVRLFAEKKEQLHLAKTLQAVGALLTTQLSLIEVFDQIFNFLGQIINYDGASVHLVEGDGGLYVAAGKGFASSQIYKTFAKDHSAEIVKRFSNGRNVWVIADTILDPNWIPTPGFDLVRSWIGAALIVKGNLIGILNVDSSKPNTYSDNMGQMVLTFANQAAVAIENARLHEETRRRANEMRVLHQIASATSVLPNIDNLLRQTTEMVAESLYTEHFGFLLYDSETNALYPHDSFFGAPKALLGRPIPMENSFCAEVYKSGQPVMVGDIKSEKKYYRVVPNTRSEIAVPLIVREEVIGVINAESPKINAFSSNDHRFLTTLAGQVATFIERGELYDEQRKYTAHLAFEVNQRTAALRAERDRMQAILDNAGEGIFFTDVDGVILYVNSAMSEMTGYSAAELLHHSPENWLGIVHQTESFDSLCEAIRSGQNWKGELIGQRKEKNSYDIHLTIAPIHNSEGVFGGFVGVHSDISYLKEVDRLKARFISNVSHELRTPLTIIEMYTTLLKRGKPERQEHYLEVLNHETKRLTQLIQDVLNLSRLEAETAPVEMNQLQLDKLLGQVVTTFLPHAETKKIALRIELESSLPPVWGNSGQIEQIVTNLVNNGLIYTPDSGMVLVTAGSEMVNDQEMVWFSVADTGPGIPEDDLPYIFDRFFRSKTVEMSTVRGTGLGLAICKEIVERHKGYIEADSVAGEGASFTVWLPVEVDLAQA